MQHTSENMMIGKRNYQVAVDILQQYNIKIVAQDIGGIRGKNCYGFS